MDKAEYIIVLEKELEYLREKLNKVVIENMINTSEEYREVLSLSTKLDVAIVNYIKISNN